jgi:hypothetical protein
MPRRAGPSCEQGSREPQVVQTNSSMVKQMLFVGEWLNLHEANNRAQQSLAHEDGSQEREHEQIGEWDEPYDEIVIDMESSG